VSQPRTTEILENVLRQRRIKTSPRDNYLAFSAEYATAQTATEVIAAPGSGKRIVMKYLSIRTVSASGKAYLEGTYNSSTLVMGMIYPAQTKVFGAADISILLDENTNVTITTTTGTSDLFTAMQWTIEDVE